ncbi:MAG TPA: HD domain-containing protein [Flavobacterium sp.]|nr:HD domain-containing protein [Flavobacterium sp.]
MTLIEKTIAFVKSELQFAEAGHDWYHIQRVWQQAKHIATDYTCNIEVVELGALLHDIADSKFHDGDENIGPKKAEKFLQILGANPATIEQVIDIIKNISFSSRSTQDKSIELQIVQDADRLDAIGAIGIARTFNFGGYKNNLMYDPEQKPRLDLSKEEYKKSDGTTINHFYEKLLLLKDTMNTEKGKELARVRHAFMEAFLQQFYDEWNAVI